MNSREPRYQARTILPHVQRVSADPLKHFSTSVDAKDIKITINSLKLLLNLRTYNEWGRGEKIVKYLR